MPYGPGPLLVRLRLLAFEFAVAGIIITQAVVGLMSGMLVDPVSDLLPMWVAVGFRIMYLVAALAMLAGLLFHRGDYEGAGLGMLMVLLSVRGFLYGHLLGWQLQSWTAITFSAFLVAACAARLSLIMWSARQRREEKGAVVAGVELEPPVIEKGE